VAALVEGEQETQAARLQSFFTFVLSGLFTQGEGDEKEEEKEMATCNHNAAALGREQFAVGDQCKLGVCSFRHADSVQV
jgi:hypothetical protein